MPLVYYKAWNSDTAAPETGDVANHTITLDVDGTTVAGLTPTEDANGVYHVEPSDAQLPVGSQWVLHGTSSTEDVQIFGTTGWRAPDTSDIEAKTDQLDFSGTGGALKSESTNMRGTDDALLAANYTAPDDTAVLAAVDGVDTKATDIKAQTDQLDYSGSGGALKAEATNLSTLLDIPITSASHNVENSLGQRVRLLYESSILSVGEVQAVTSDTVTLESAVSPGQMIVCNSEAKYITNYDAGVATLSSAWNTNPSVGDQYIIISIRDILFNELTNLYGAESAGSAIKSIERILFGTMRAKDGVSDTFEIMESDDTTVYAEALIRDHTSPYRKVTKNE